MGKVGGGLGTLYHSKYLHQKKIPWGWVQTPLSGSRTIPTMGYFAYLNKLFTIYTLLLVFVLVEFKNKNLRQNIFFILESLTCNFVLYISNKNQINKEFIY